MLVNLLYILVVVEEAHEEQRRLARNFRQRRPKETRQWLSGTIKAGANCTETHSLKSGKWSPREPTTLAVRTNHISVIRSTTSGRCSRCLTTMIENKLKRDECYFLGHIYH